MGFLGAAHELEKGGGAKTPALPKIYHTHPIMMKLGTVTPYLRKIQKHIRYKNHVTHPLSLADIRIFSPEIGKFCSIKKNRCRLHFDT